MQFDDLHKEFERIRACLQSGTKKLGAKDYEAACGDFEECLELLEKGHPQDHPDRIACLKGLGDTYFALRRYGEARQMFKALIKIDDNHPNSTVDALTTQFKLAKSADRAGDPKEALATYERLTQLAEKSLCEGHPFLSSILESQADLLSRNGAPKEAEALGKKARANRTKYSQQGSLPDNVLSGLNRQSERGGITEADPDSSVNNEAPLSPHGRDPTSRLRAREQVSEPSSGPDLERRQTVATGAAIILLLVAVTGTFSMFQHSHKQSRSTAAAQIASQNVSGAATENFQKQKYISLNGQESLELIDRVSARLTAGGQSRSVGWSKRGSVLANLHKEDGFVFTDNGGVLIDQNGLKLYDQHSVDLQIVQNMQTMAQVADLAFKTDNKYPEDLERLLILGQGRFLHNPVDANNLPIQIVYAGHDKQWDPNSPTQVPKLLAQLGQLGQTGPVIFGNNLIPGCVYGYYLLSGHSSSGLSVRAFFVRGCDKQGQMIQSGNPPVCTVLGGINGRNIQRPLASAADAKSSPWQKGEAGFVIIDSGTPAPP